MTLDPTPVLSVRNLSVDFEQRLGNLHAVNDVSFDLYAGKTLCIVGESGSGKSVTARALMQLVDPPGRVVSGSIRFGSTDIVKLPRRGAEIRAIRGASISMIFQEPMSSLSPVHTIGSQIAEVLRKHLNLSRRESRERTIELLSQVEIPRPMEAVDRYTYEFSGGMRQRAMIAMALACNPRVLIADEPTTALDVTTQAEVLDLIRRLQSQHGMAMLLITHDMGVVAETADDVLVMYRGQIVERGTTDNVFHNAVHPYTRRLLDATLKLETSASRASRGAENEKPILSLRNVGKTYTIGQGVFGGRSKRQFAAVENINFDLMPGETLGIVGESGSGKTTLGRLILRTVEPTTGEISYIAPNLTPVDVRKLDKAGLRRLYRDIRFIFQDPFSSLNPRMTVRQIIGEPLLVNRIGNSKEIGERVGKLLSMVGLESSMMDRYPHAFSGGQRQRIGIARALALDPKILIADEPTSALDVSIRSQILDLLLDLRQRLNLSFVFISHDIGVIRYFCDRVAVMRRGQIVELGDALTVCNSPTHPYTQALISAVPFPDPRRPRMKNRLKISETSIEGDK